MFAGVIRPTMETMMQPQVNPQPKFEIDFQPESQAPELLQAVSDYNAIWSVEGERMLRELERFSGLQFDSRASIAATVLC